MYLLQVAEICDFIFPLVSYSSKLKEKQTYFLQIQKNEKKVNIIRSCKLAFLVFIVGIFKIFSNSTNRAYIIKKSMMTIFS